MKLHRQKECLGSAGVYVLEGTKFSLQLLQSVSNLIPIPWIGSAIQVATAIIDTSQTMKNNKDGRNELNGRICALLLVLLAPLKGKEESNAPPELKADILRITADLQNILVTIEAMSKQNFIQATILAALNARHIQDCSSSLDASLRKFSVSREINAAVRLAELVSGIENVQKEVVGARDHLQHIHGDVKHVQGAMENVQGALTEVVTTLSDVRQIVGGTQGRQPLPTMVIPPRPRIFHGRDKTVNTIASCLSTVETPRIALVGPGGMGKTSVALAIMAHYDTIRRFGPKRCWVPCTEVTSPERLIDLIAAALQIEDAGSDRLQVILRVLNSSEEPYLLLLDNFETAWDLPGQRSKVEDTLCTLASVSRLAIFVTMRSNLPPSLNIKWDLPELSLLPPLSESAACRVYTEIHPAAMSDPQLTTLLAEMGQMPLAVNLMARVGLNSGETPSDLLISWRDERIRTDLLELGQDAQKSINQSILLSLRSNLLANNPDAITLLAILSMLPGGIQRGILSSLAPSITNLTQSLVVLFQSALAERRSDDKSIHVLPPVRAYMLRFHPLRPTVRKQLHEGYYKLLHAHASEPGNSTFVDDMLLLGSQETNLAAVLVDGMKHGSAKSAVTASLIFAWYQHHARPHVELIELVVATARTAGDSALLAESLRCHGFILYKQSRWEESRSVLEEAKATFQQSGDALGSARCLQRLGDAHFKQSRYDEAQTALEASQMMFQLVGNSVGVAQCLQRLGDIHRLQGRYDDASRALEAARAELIQLKDPRSAAQCLRSIGNIHRMQSRYDEARLLLEQARREFLQIKDLRGATQSLRSLADILHMQQRNDEAQAAYDEAREEFIRLNNPLGAAQCLKSLGDILFSQRQYHESLKALENSLKEFKRLKSPLGAAHCMCSIGGTMAMLLKVEDARMMYDEALRAFRSLKDRSGAAHCLKATGDIALTEDRLADAELSISEALQEFRLLSNDAQVTDCLGSLEIIHSRKRQHNVERYHESDKLKDISTDLSRWPALDYVDSRHRQADIPFSDVSAMSPYEEKLQSLVVPTFSPSSYIDLVKLSVAT